MYTDVCAHAWTQHHFPYPGNSRGSSKSASLATEGDFFPGFAVLVNAAHWAADLHAQLLLQGLL